MNSIKRVFGSLILLLLPSFAVAQYQDVTSLVGAYAKQKGISHTHLGKGMIWMAKASAPKGAMDGVESIDVLKFDNGVESPLFIKFKASADSLFAAIGAECVVSEPTKKGSMDVFMERKESPTEYMMFTYDSRKGDVGFLWMQGNIPSSL